MHVEHDKSPFRRNLEMVGRDILRPSLRVAAALLIANAGIQVADSIDQNKQQTASNAPEHFTEIGLEWQGITEGVQSIGFLSTPAEFYDARTSEETAEAFLKNHGIGWQRDKRGEEGEYYLRPTPARHIVDILGRVPCSAIRFSGLKQINFTEYVDDSAPHELYTHQQDSSVGVANIYHYSQLTPAIGAMVLDKLPEKAEILQKYTDITEKAGQTYDTKYEVKIKNYTKSDRRKMYDSFEVSQSQSSPEVEFALNFGEVLVPEGSVSLPLDNPELPKTQKMQIAIDVFNSIVPNGNILLKLRSYEHQFGTHGASPLDNLGRIKALSTALNSAKTRQAQRKILTEDNETNKYYQLDGDVQKTQAENC